jgi:hypothetical protein
MSKARELAELGAVYDSGALSNRNIIINGAMQVAQRGTSSTGLGTTAGYYTVDRYNIAVGGTATAGRFTMTQESDGPSALSGLANSIKLACTTADTSIAAGENLRIVHIMEGQDLQRLKKGTSSAESFTISFYVKGNAAATYICEVYDLDNGRHIGKTFNVTSDWNRIELTFPGDTTGALDDDNASSLQITFWLHSGTTNTSGTLPATWAAASNANRAGGLSTSFYDSTSRTFFLTGLQMEVGTEATPFEHRSFGQELALCQRYYFQETTTPADASGILGVASGAAAVVFNQTLPVQMRANPSVSLTSTNLRIGDMVAAGFTTTSGTIAIGTFSGSTSATYTLGGFSGLTSYRSYLSEPDATSTGLVKSDAEL